MEIEVALQILDRSRPRDPDTSDTRVNRGIAAKPCSDSSIPHWDLRSKRGSNARIAATRAQTELAEDERHAVPLPPTASGRHAAPRFLGSLERMQATAPGAPEFQEFRKNAPLARAPSRANTRLFYCRYQEFQNSQKFLKIPAAAASPWPLLFAPAFQAHPRNSWNSRNSALKFCAGSTHFNQDFVGDSLFWGRRKLYTSSIWRFPSQALA